MGFVGATRRVAPSGSFLVPKLLLGNAYFTPSSAWGHRYVKYNLLKLRNFFAKQELAKQDGSQAGAWEPGFGKAGKGRGGARIALTMLFPQEP